MIIKKLFNTFRFCYLFRALFLCFFASLLFSCNDQGCIDADDFGEYESQTLEIASNIAEDNCKFDSSKDIYDTSQGSSLKPCIVKETNSVTLLISGSPVTVKNDSGCASKGFGTLSESDKQLFQKVCIEQCIQKCIQSAAYGGSQPNWKSTDLRSKGGVNISPNSQVIIQVAGSVRLGDDYTYQDLYIQANNPHAHSKNINWNDNFFNVIPGEDVRFKFSGSWNNGNEDIGAGKSSFSDGSDSKKIYEGARRLVAYLTPHPNDYKFNLDAGNEKEGSLEVPLFPDPSSWKCYHSNISDLTEMECSVGSYNDLGYKNVSDTKAKNLFPLVYPPQEYGGLVMPYTSVNNKSNFPYIPKPSTYDPFEYNGAKFINSDKKDVTDINSTFSSENFDKVSSDQGIILNNGTSDVSITNPYSNGSAVMIYFKNLTKDKNCNISINVNDIKINESSWTYVKTLENNQTVKINRLTENTKCGKVIGVKIIKLHEIEIFQSGFARFTNLGYFGNSDNCYINARIINPIDNYVEGGVNNDFYEYANFDNNNDPLKNLNVPASSFGGGYNWSSNFFVRKGQKIRFAPESWDKERNVVTADSKIVKRSCGIGMAIYIEPRPALLCKGTSESIVPNALCVQQYSYNNKTLVGCTPYYKDCFNSSSDHYCPSSCIQVKNENDGSSFVPQSGSKIIKCDNKGTKENLFKQNCSQDGGSYGNSCDQAKCNRCFDKMIIAGNLNAQITKNLAACYDLEEYKGKVSNLDPNFPKGAVELKSFDGTSYGNFSDFIISNDVDKDTKNNIFSLKNPITFSKSARVSFFVLDSSDDFRDLDDTYSNNSKPQSIYDGTNGMKVSPSTTLEFYNGKWLEAVLCDKGDNCNTSSLSINGDTDYISDDIVSKDKVNEKNYYFNEFGSLVRKGATSGSDCNNISKQAVMMVGSAFFCHTKNREDLRISFKIEDPEVGSKECNDSKVLIKNPSYDYDSNNAGKVCDSKESNCKKQYYCGSKYDNNSGKYYVTVKIKNNSNGISNVIGSIINPVIDILDNGEVKRAYNAIINDDRYKAILRMCLVMMYTFYGVGYLMGILELNHNELVIRVIRIGLIFFFVGPGGWDNFNDIIVKFFKDATNHVTFLMASSFDDSPGVVSSISNQNYSDKSILFTSVDKVMGLFFASAVQKKISALLFASVFGFVYLMIIYSSFFLYVYAVSNAVLIYITAQIFISILFTLFPIFAVFVLFSQTKQMFDNWLNQVISFSLQQIFLLTTLSFFNMMIYEVIKMSLGYRVCWDEVWTINIITRITLMSFWTLAALPPRTDSQTEVGNIGNVEGIPSFFSILSIWVFASLFGTFVEFMTSIASSISGGSLTASTLAEGAKSAMKSANDFVSGAVDNGFKKTFGKLVDRVDDVLFDSGETAEKKRKEAKQQDSKDRDTISTLRDAGEDAVKKFKIKNSDQLAGMSKEEQKKKLEEVRNSGIAKKAGKLNIDATELKRLNNKKGIDIKNLEDLPDLVSQMWDRRGNISKSLNEEGPKTELSKDEISEIEKNINSIKNEHVRETALKDLKNNIESGKLKVEKSFIQNATKSANKAYESLKNLFNKNENDEAEKILSDTGEISTNQVLGSGAISRALRSNKENKKISEKAKELKEAKKISSNTIDTSILSDMNIESEISRDKVDNSGKETEFVKADGSEKTLSNYFAKIGLGKKDARNRIRKGKNNSANNFVAENKKNLSEQLQTAKNDVSRFDDEIAKNFSQRDLIENFISQKQENYKNAKTTEEKQSISRDLSEAKINLDKTNININNATVSKNIASDKISRIENKIENIDNAVKINDKVNQYLDSKGGTEWDDFKNNSAKCNTVQKDFFNAIESGDFESFNKKNQKIAGIDKIDDNTKFE